MTAAGEKVSFGSIAREVKEHIQGPLAAGIERYVGLEHIDPEEIAVTRWGSVADGTTFTKRFRAGQLLFARRRAYQRKAGVADFDGVCSGDIIVMEALPDQVVPELLPFIVHTDEFLQHALSTSAGSLSPRTKWRDIAKLEITLPSLDRQREIVDVLIAADAVVRSPHLAHMALSRVEAAYLGEVFNAAHPEMPFAAVMAEKTKNGLYKPRDCYGLGPAMVHMSDMFSSRILDRTGVTNRVSVDPGEQTRFALSSGDLLFARRSLKVEGAGACVLVDQIEDPTTFESSIIRARLDRSKADPWFIAGYFWSPQGAVAIKRIVRTVAASGITASDLQQVPIPVPPLEFQRQVGATLRRTFDAAVTLSTTRRQSASLTQHLRDRLFG